MDSSQERTEQDSMMEKYMKRPKGMPVTTDPELSSRLLDVDQWSNFFINVYPSYEKMQVSIPLLNDLGEVERDMDGKPFSVGTREELVYAGPKEEVIAIPSLISEDMVKSILGPREIPLMMQFQDMITKLYFLQFKLGKKFTNNLMRFQALLRTLINIRRSYAGFAPRVSKSEISYLYQGTNEADEYMKLEEQMRNTERNFIEKAKEKAGFGGKRDGLRDEADKIARTAEKDSATDFAGGGRKGKGFEW